VGGPHTSARAVTVSKSDRALDTEGGPRETAVGDATRAVLAFAARPHGPAKKGAGICAILTTGKKKCLAGIVVAALAYATHLPLRDGHRGHSRQRRHSSDVECDPERPARAGVQAPREVPTGAKTHAPTSSPRSAVGVLSVVTRGPSTRIRSTGQSELLRSCRSRGGRRVESAMSDYEHFSNCIRRR
jgi:hypothetical protein